ncbi:MAG: hypothetical protein RIF33_12270 [Cyclobacteriaceae bacterium]
MSKSESFDTLKAQLVRKERLYKSKISEQSDELEVQSKKFLKSSAIVGGGLMLGFGLFKLLAGKSKEQKVAPQKKKVEEVKAPSKKNVILRAAIIDKLVAFVIQLGFRYLSKKIKSSDEGDSQSTTK